MRRSTTETDKRVLRQIGDVYRALSHERDDEAYSDWAASFQSLHPTFPDARLDSGRLADRFGLSARREDLDLTMLMCSVESVLIYWLLLTASQSEQPQAQRPPNPAEIAERMSDDSFQARPGATLKLPLGASIIGSLPERLVDDLGWTWLKLMESHQPDPLTDIAHELHHWAVPRELRHGIGAYYTPNWLADYVTSSTIDLSCLEETRVIDPTCGSGAFLVSACRALLARVEDGHVSADSALNWIMESLYGFDIDPLATLAAQVNLLLAADRLCDRGASRPSTLVFNVELRDIVRPLPKGLKNSFDAVVGNPPWVNWETLPADYRDRVAPLWVDLGIFDSSGRDLSFSKEDLSALITYIAADDLLADSGRLGFILPQSLLKSSLNGRGFRQFQIRGGETPLQVLAVDDFSAIRVFGSAASRPIVLHLTKGTATAYPVDYRSWSTATRFGNPETWDEAERSLRTAEECAVPTSSKPGAHWSVAPQASLDIIDRLQGDFPYKPRTGAFTGGANAVYYLRRIGNASTPGNVVMENIVARAKRRVEQAEAELECEYLYPLLRGREVGQWHSDRDDFVLCPHTRETRMAAIPPAELKRSAPQTYSYLDQHKSALLDRKGFSGWEKRYFEEAFYATQRIGDYTFADYKVVWRYISPTFTTAVIGPGEDPCGAPKPVVPHEKLIQIATTDADEAYYICGVLSSTPAIAFVESRMVSTQVSPHVVTGFGMPMFDALDDRHMRVAELTRKGHDTRADCFDADVAELFAEIDETVSAMFDLPAGAVRALASRTGRR